MRTIALILTSLVSATSAQAEEWQATADGALLEANGTRLFDALVTEEGSLLVASADAMLMLHVADDVAATEVYQGIVERHSGRNYQYWIETENGIEHIIVTEESNGVRISISGLTPQLISDEVVGFLDHEGALRFRYGSLYVEDARHVQQGAHSQLMAGS